MIGYIYKITNSVNGKCYIGQTIRSVGQRFKEHFHPSSGCLFLQRAIIKYGKDAFRVETLESINGESKTEIIKKLNEIEIKYINANNSLFPHGYNGHLGGRNAADYKWVHGMSPESIAIRAEKHKNLLNAMKPDKYGHQLQIVQKIWE
jgi:group I intron endonuclease